MKIIYATDTYEFEMQIGCDLSYIKDSIIYRESGWVEGFCDESNEAFYIKKAADIIIFVPIEDHFEHAFCMPLEQYNQLRVSECEWPAYEAIPSLTKKDCAQIFWQEAPDKIKTVKYRNEKYRFDKDAYLNNTSDEPEILSILEKILNEYSSSDDPVTLRPISDDDEIAIILDAQDYFEWQAMCKRGNGYGLCLEPGYQVLEVGEGNIC